MEGSRRGKRSTEKGLPTPDPHVEGGNGKNAIVYNTKKENKGGRLKKDSSKRKELSILSHSIRECPRIHSVYVRVQLFLFNTINQYLYPGFRLTFSPALYKFIVRAFWAWVHSCSGFKSNLVPTYIYIYIYI